MSLQKIKVVVVVYNRYDNLKKWLECWKSCYQLNSELIVIHNFASHADVVRYQHLCEEYNVSYISRTNIGYDIGAFQDVCVERLNWFDNNWDLLFWSTDDTIIMRKDFLKVFVDSMSRTVGVSCLEISTEVRPHIRTSGFCIRKAVATKLKFPSETITTKEHCYQFEHRSNQTFLRQVKDMGFNVVMPLTLKDGAMWDVDHRRYLNRMDEHNLIFPNMSKVTFICPVFNTYPEIISSLICQTHKNWELLLIHDGSNNTGLGKLVKAIGDSRITYIETEKRVGNWGHYLRQWALNEIKHGVLAKGTDYVVITNADNHHVPVFCEYMLKGFINSSAVATYCSKMVHSYTAWDILESRMQLGYIDCAAVMIKKDAACNVGWNDITGHSADWSYFKDVMDRYGESSFVKVKGCLLIHN